MGDVAGYAQAVFDAAFRGAGIGQASALSGMGAYLCAMAGRA